MTDTLHTLTALRERHQPQPPASTIKHAAQRGSLITIKPGNEYLATTKDYLIWLQGYPHPRFGRTQLPVERMKE